MSPVAGSVVTPSKPKWSWFGDGRREADDRGDREVRGGVVRADGYSPRTDGQRIATPPTRMPRPRSPPRARRRPRRSRALDVDVDGAVRVDERVDVEVVGARRTAAWRSRPKRRRPEVSSMVISRTMVASTWGRPRRCRARGCGSGRRSCRRRSGVVRGRRRGRSGRPRGRDWRCRPDRPRRSTGVTPTVAAVDHDRRAELVAAIVLLAGDDEEIAVGDREDLADAGRQTCSRIGRDAPRRR